MKDFQRGGCRVKFLTKVGSRMHFCHEAALVRVDNGLNQFVVREGRTKDSRAIYLNRNLLAYGDAKGCPTCSMALYHGYGKGVMPLDEATFRMGKAMNRPYEGLEDAVGRIAPLLGLCESGYYIVADCDQFPSVRDAAGRVHDFVREDVSPAFDGAIRFMSGTCYTSFHNTPLYLWATQNPCSILRPRVRRYVGELEKRGEDSPRPIALYLNGGVSLLVDGHHKCAAAATLGRPIRTLVIFKLDPHDRLAECVANGERLFFGSVGSFFEFKEGQAGNPPGYAITGHPPYLSDAKDGCYSPVSCLSYYSNVQGEDDASWGPSHLFGWEGVPSLFMRDYSPHHEKLPTIELLERGTRVWLPHIRESIAALRKAAAALPKAEEPKFASDMLSMREDLLRYKELFPHSKWISAEEECWLKRLDGLVQHDVIVRWCRENNNPAKVLSEERRTPSKAPAGRN